MVGDKNVTLRKSRFLSFNSLFSYQKCLFNICDSIRYSLILWSFLICDSWFTFSLKFLFQNVCFQNVSSHNVFYQNKSSEYVSSHFNFNSFQFHFNLLFFCLFEISLSKISLSKMSFSEICIQSCYDRDISTTKLI